MMNLCVNNKVWWEDPDNGECSSTFIIGHIINADMYYLDDGMGGGIEAYKEDVTVLDGGFNCLCCGCKCYDGEGCDEFKSISHSIIHCPVSKDGEHKTSWDSIVGDKVDGETPLVFKCSECGCVGDLNLPAIDLKALVVWPHAD